MNNIKFFGLNCNGRTHINSVDYTKVANYVLDNNVDIFTLNEFCYFKSFDLNSLLNEEYKLIYDKNKQGNQVLIGFKLSLWESFQEINEIEVEEYFKCIVHKPNFLALKIRLANAQIINVIGLRITVLDSSLNDAMDRYQQLIAIKEVLNSIPKDEVIIGAGDFNNYHFSEKDIPKYQADEILCQHYYSYFIIKNELSEINVSLLTPEDGFSWNDKKLYKYKLDHIFTRNAISKNIKYDIGFRDEHFNNIDFINKDGKELESGFDHSPIIGCFEF